MLIDTLSDHELFLALKSQNAEAWRHVWEKVVQVECKVRGNAEMIRKWGVSPEEVMSVLYSEMIGHDKISALVSAEVVEGGWTSLVATDGVHPHPVAGCRRVGKGVLAYVSQRMFGTRFNRDMNVGFWSAVLTASVRASGKPAEGPVADQSAINAPVRISAGRALVCAPESLRDEAEDYALQILSNVATNNVRILLCDSSVQDTELCGKPVFRHFGAFCSKSSKSDERKEVR